jgi:homoserine/homoserine lactone efflux protein
MEFSTWLLYALAATGLSLTPGPNGLLALTHGALHGTKKTVATILGGISGFALVIAASMFGIGAVLKASVELLTVLKWAGGAYLVWLGVQVWRSAPIGVDQAAKTKKATGASMFRAGLLSATTNPKGILFFVAFLPQFIDPAKSLWIQFLVMATTFMVIEFFYELLVAGLADKIQPFLKRAGKNFNRVFGGIFMAIGVLLPLR